MKLHIRTAAPAHSPSPYVDSLAEHRSVHHDIKASDLVEMVDRLLLRIQSEVQPSVSWARMDLPHVHITSMQWLDAQLELVVALHSSGFTAWLYPHFNSSHGGDYNTYVGYWYSCLGPQGVYFHASEITYLAGASDRIIVSPSDRIVRFDDPVFGDIPRYVDEVGAPELGDDIVAVIRRCRETPRF